MNIQPTLEGYICIRCRALGTDDSFYIHQLNAIHNGADPAEVFAEGTAVHHRPLSDVLELDEYVPPPPWDCLEEPETVEIPRGVEVRDESDHGREHAEAQQREAPAGGPAL